MVDRVEGGGWISDDSDFYGDASTRTRLEERAGREAGPLMNPSLSLPKGNRESGRSTKPRTVTQTYLKSLTSKSRQRFAPLEENATFQSKPVKQEPARTAGGEEVADLLEHDRFPGNPAAWQQHETIDEFLKRAPIVDPATATLGPWLWVGNPKIRWSHKKHEAKTDIVAFEESGEMLLEAFSVQKAKIESSKPDAPPGTITRLMRPYKEQLEDDLLALAVKTATTCGKWMLFPAFEDVPRYWRLVAQATADGKLGPTSKAATFSPTDSTTLICIYTYDFTDEVDVRRVLVELVELELCKVDSKPIYYKCDAYTYLDIKSDNEYKIRASLYSSKDILGREAKPTQEGPIARLKKRNNRVTDNFFAS